MWGPCYSIPKAIFYLLKGDYKGRVGVPADGPHHAIHNLSRPQSLGLALGEGSGVEVSWGKCITF